MAKMVYVMIDIQTASGQHQQVMHSFVTQDDNDTVAVRHVVRHAPLVTEEPPSPPPLPDPDEVEIDWDESWNELGNGDDS